MIKIDEENLEQYIEKFNAKNIEIKVTGLFKQNTKVKLAEFDYNPKNGKIKIRNNTVYLKIDLSFVYRIEINEELNRLSFYFDDEMKVTIAK